MARPTSAGRQAGFTYLAVLVVVATMGAVLVAVGELSSHAARREKEAELLFVGEQYRQAIASYYERSPGGAKRYPQKLEDLMEDRRFPTLQRHLRRPYADPMTGGAFATLEGPGGGIMGVFSPSETAPLKTGNFRKRDESFAEAGQYADWKFLYQPPGETSPSPDGLRTSQARNTSP